MTKKTFLLFAALILGIVTASNVQANDGFGALSGRTANAAEATTELTTLEEFRELLDGVPKQEFREVSENVWLMNVQHEDFRFPVVVNYTSNGSAVWNILRLAQLPKGLPADEVAYRLSKLLSDSGNRGNCFFSLDDESMTVLLLGCIENNGKLEREDYIKHLIQMADVAVESEALWNPAVWNQEAPRHVGQWSSECGTMQLNLTEIEKFELIVGKTVTSGKYSIDDNNINMVDSNGDNLEGELIFDNANQFRLIVGGNSTSFTRL